MYSHLVTLRQNAPLLTPAKFLAANPGCWIQYYDDTSAKDPAKALSSARFEPEVAARKQREGCAVGFSLQAFGASRTKENLLCFRNLGVDVDLVPAAEKGALSSEDIDQRKNDYLRRCLLRFPLKPHWLIETRHGFHIIFRIQPQRHADGIREAEVLTRRLVRTLHGDPNAALLTQLLRVPGTYHLKDPTNPFLCRLLLDNAPTILPYSLAVVRSALAEWDGQAGGSIPSPRTRPGAEDDGRVSRWREGLAGVCEGERNATAASLVGKILGGLPEELWEIAGWGGLKEWNARNRVPLPERELRSVFENIARRERERRPHGGIAAIGGQTNATIAPARSP